MNQLRIFVVLSLFVSGCVAAISHDIAAQADRTITFSMVQADPDAFAGRLIILGGVIDRIIDTEHGTLLSVLQKPLDYWDKPTRTRGTGGYFLALKPGHLDPLIFTPGREITMAAEVLGTRSPVAQDPGADYPVLAVKELKLWDREPRASSRPQWIDPLYDPGSPGRHEW